MSPSRLPSAAARKLLLKNLPPDQRRELRRKVSGLKAFADGFVGIHLWPYQLEAADAIVKSVLDRDGESFVLIFARQSGKDELLANLILYLLARFAEPGSIHRLCAAHFPAADHQRHGSSSSAYRAAPLLQARWLSPQPWLYL